MPARRQHLEALRRVVEHRGALLRRRADRRGEAQEHDAGVLRRERARAAQGRRDVLAEERVVLDHQREPVQATHATDVFPRRHGLERGGVLQGVG
jgi:hypothetical protein